MTNNFVVPGTCTVKADLKKTPTLKEFNLGEAALFRLSLCTEVVKI